MLYPCFGFRFAHAWLELESSVNIPILNAAVSYIPIIKVPLLKSFADDCWSAISEMCSTESGKYKEFNSPALYQRISPSKYSGFALDGVPPLVNAPISPIFTRLLLLYLGSPNSSINRDLTSSSSFSCVKVHLASGFRLSTPVFVHGTSRSAASRKFSGRLVEVASACATETHLHFPTEG